MSYKIRKKLSLSGRKALTAQVFLSPFYLGVLFFFIRPLLDSLRMSFSNISLDSSGYKYGFNGFENYVTAFVKDTDFTTNLVTSMVSLLWQLPVILVISIFLAQIINQKFKGRLLIRAIFFLPVIFASGVVLSIIQNDFIASSALTGKSITGGVVTQSSALKDLLINAGLGSGFVNLATTITDSLFAMVWRSGIQMIVFLTGLQSIPPSLYEASSIEGASAWENFWKITIPMLVPMFLVNVVYTIVDGFTDAENKIMMQISNLMSQQAGKLGLASAFAWTYFLFISLVLALFIFIVSRVGRDSLGGDRS